MVSFDLGGEKLKSSIPRGGVFFAILYLIIGIYSAPLSAQGLEPPEPIEADVEAAAPIAAAAVDESAIILGETIAAPAPVGGSSVFVVFRMVFVLALAALAIYGVVFFIKRLARPQEIRDPHLKVLARTPLSNDSFAAVISLGAKAWLVAGATGTVNLISEINDPESLETMLLDDSQRVAETKPLNFISLLRRFGAYRGRKENKTPGNFPADSSPPAGNSTFAESLRQQGDRLRGLQDE